MSLQGIISSLSSESVTLLALESKQVNLCHMQKMRYNTTTTRPEQVGKRTQMAIIIGDTQAKSVVPVHKGWIAFMM